MTNENTTTRWGYLLWNLLMGTASVAWYKIFFKLLPGLTYTLSRYVLYLLLLCSIAVGIALTIRKRRNGLSLAVNLLLPFELYTALTYAKLLKGFLIAAVALTVVLAAVYMYLVLSSGIPRHEDQSRAKRKQLTHGLLGARTIAAFCGLLILLPLIYCSVFLDSLYPKSEIAVVGTMCEEYTIENHSDALQGLFEENWKNCTYKEKLDLMQIVANAQAYRFGLPHELNVRIESEGEGTIAEYTEDTHTITLNVNYFDLSSSEVTDSVCHEAYHAYQYALVQAYDDIDPAYRSLRIFENAEIFKAELEDYVHGEDDFTAYYMQLTEATARRYAADETERIFLTLIASKSGVGGTE